MLSVLVSFLLLIVTNVVVGTSAVRSVGSTVILNKRHYFISPIAEGRVPIACRSIWNSLTSDHEYVPVTIIDTSDARFSHHDLDTVTSMYLQQDDVFNEAFLSALVVKTSHESRLQASLGEQESDDSRCFISDSSHDVPPPGPYFVSTRTGMWHIPYRLYADFQGSFADGVIPSVDGGYESIPAAIPASSSMTIGVPSRLYYQRTAKLPLAGVRVGVKDIYDLQGLKTGAGSRAYYEIYPEANSTAPSVQRLIDAGAVIVGKMKTTQFAAPEFVSLAIDYQAPFNGRADGYQEPGSSSSGAGSGIGSYDWLDIALGSDTGGSVRVPAQENGVYGNRPSHGHVSLDHVVPEGPSFDTAGLLARDPQLWREACRVLYSGLSTNYTRFPTRIQTFGLYSASPSPANTIISSFIHKLSGFLSADVTELNYTQRWLETRPEGADPSISRYLNTTWSVLAFQPQVELVRQPFFADYAAKYGGRQPYVNPASKEAWDWILAETPDVDEATTQRNNFKKWWNTQIVHSSPDSCSDSLVLYVGKNALGTTGKPSYRDKQIPNIGILTGLLGGLFISPLSKGPDFVLPLGEVPYHSTITNHTEMLPVTIDILAARGCDLMLLDLINELHAAKILPSIKPGNSIHGGHIFR